MVPIKDSNTKVMIEQLRDYQQSMLQDLRRTWKRHQSMMVQMPTGTGKTHLMAAVICDHADKGVLVVAHRIELIGQISRTLSAFGIEHGLIVSGSEADTGKPVQVASIQTLARRMDETLLNPALVIVDEAHHALAKTYRMLWERWTKARFLGLTATPCRLNNAPFTDLFQKLLQSYSIQEFIDRGWLADFDYVSASPDSEAMKQVRALKKRGADGDYQVREMATVMDCPESIEHLYKTYHQFADGKKGIVYAIDRQHARHITEYYQTQGVCCCMIDSKTPEAERRQAIEDYRLQTIDVLVNVDIFSEGFDCPEVEFIQLARPTLSLSKYLQQVGRGMRIGNSKSPVLILDNVGLYQQFGLPTADRDWQRLFLGKEAGKGIQDLERCVVVDDEAQNKDLVNLKMVRIKSSGERRAGLEVFLQNGFYGVMRNGKITCPAHFKKVKRLQGDCGFFALGIYMRRNEHNFGKLEEITTVIDRKGQDLKVTLYGNVDWCNGYFYGELVGTNFIKSNSWDPVGNSYYDSDPCFRNVAGVEVGFSNEHSFSLKPCMKLRLSTGRVSPRFYVSEMFYNHNIIIARDYLVVKTDKNHSYRIKGYLDNSVLVESEEQYGFQQIMSNGKMGQFYSKMPNDSTRIFNATQLGLRRVQTD